MFTLWFMGRPASGKSTIASQIESELYDLDYPIENLDGDEIRKNLHPDLGFSREDRRINNRRTAFISKLLNRNGIPTVVGMITPFRESQRQAREIIESEGKFVLIYVKCSKEECERRDPKGLYEQAQEGKIEKFTGVNHPFQEPLNPEIIIDSEQDTVEECVETIMEELRTLGVLDETLEDNYGFSISKSEEEEILQRLEDREYLEG
ncbi:adenylyl-sulfate kinase [Halosimplex halobium]|uniref:adenylyl-sulfate kinase n=1 Tax=Halosimplex halobium TaxID=3396618 RepID=UPI003F572743